MAEVFRAHQSRKDPMPSTDKWTGVICPDNGALPVNKANGAWMQTTSRML